jgi:hypothetical protein
LSALRGVFFRPNRRPLETAEQPGGAPSRRSIVLSKEALDDDLTMSTGSLGASPPASLPLRALFVAIASMPILAACLGDDPSISPGGGGGGDAGTAGQTLDCRQKAGSDTDSECTVHAGKPRKLDCDGVAQTDQAIAAGCVRAAAGSDDVCCPTTLQGTSSSTPGATTVACRQEAGSDTDSECTSKAGKPRKLDCGSTAETDEAIGAGCERVSPTSSDVCCPTTVSGTPDDTTSTAPAQAIWELALSGASGCGSLPTLTFGSFAPTPTPVKNGQTVGGSTALVVCSVKPSSTSMGAYAVNAAASMTGGAGVQIAGTLNESSTPGVVTGTFNFSDGTSFVRSGCTVSYPPLGRIAGGRVWAKLECAPEAGATTIPGTCTAIGQLRFENCASK